MRTFTSVAVIAAIAAAFVAQTEACSSAQTLIEQAEGLRLCMYHDTRGIPTICYGFNLQRSDARSRIEGVGGNYNSVMNGGCLSQSQCSELLGPDVRSAAEGAARVFGNQCQCVQAALTDMTYNLGVGGIGEFNTFISYVRSHNWAAAAHDLYGTLWCSQVGNRCSRDAGIIANGC